MCIDCQGLGYQYGANLTHKQDIMLQPADGLIRWLWGFKYSQTASKWFDIFLEAEKINPYIPLNELPKRQLQMILNGSPPDKWYKTHQGLTFRWWGINNVLARIGSAGKTEVKETVIPLLDEITCYSCQGARLNPLARHVTINETPLHMHLSDANKRSKQLHRNLCNSKAMTKKSSKRFTNSWSLDSNSSAASASTTSASNVELLRSPAAKHKGSASPASWAADCVVFSMSSMNPPSAYTPKTPKGSTAPLKTSKISATRSSLSNMIPTQLKRPTISLTSVLQPAYTADTSLPKAPMTPSSQTPIHSRANTFQVPSQ